MEALLPIKLTIKSYVQFISLKKLFSQSTIYNSFRLKKKTQFRLKKIIPSKIHIFENRKKIQLKNGSFYELTPLSHTLG